MAAVYCGDCFEVETKTEERNGRWYRICPQCGAETKMNRPRVVTRPRVEPRHPEMRRRSESFRRQFPDAWSGFDKFMKEHTDTPYEPKDPDVEVSSDRGFLELRKKEV
jgi:hypothetical protein